MSDITIRNNDLLNAAFNDETILSADLPQLKRYLLACTETRETDILNPRVKDGLPRRSTNISTSRQRSGVAAIICTGSAFVIHSIALFWRGFSKCPCGQRSNRAAGRCKS